MNEWISYFILIINDRVFSNFYVQCLPHRRNLQNCNKMATYYEGAVWRFFHLVILQVLV